MNGVIAYGYVTITTDAGLGAAEEATPWAQVSEGNVSLYNLQNFASVALNDEVCARLLGEESEETDS